MISETTEWLRELGAVRPMSPAGTYSLSLGKWHAGFYPILYESELRHPRMGSPPKWYIYGIETARPLTRKECERILKTQEETVE